MRSQFLTLLCVLTFLSCGWGLFDATISFLETNAVSETPYVKPHYTPEEQKKLPKQYFEDRAASGDQPMPDDPDVIRSLAAAQFAYSLLTLLGAILMFRLRRIGFWIYIAGVAIGIILPVSLVGPGALNTSFGVFFSIIFAGLYWLNLKDMQ